MIWWILITILVLFLVWLLLGPVILFLDTDNNRYVLALPGIISLALVPSDELFHIRCRVFFIPFQYHPFREKRKKRKKKKEEKGKEKPEKKKRFKKPSGSFRLGMDLLRSFRIRKLFLLVDTDDFVLNAWLIPVFSIVNSDNIQLKANFTGYFSMLLDVRTRLGVLLWNFIRNRIKSIF